MDKAELIYGNFTMDRIEEIVDLVVQSFSTNNPFLTNGAQTPQTLRKRSTQRIQYYYAAMNNLNKDKGSNYQLMKVLIYKGQIVAFAMVCQLHRMIDYRMPTAQPGSTPAMVFQFFNKKAYHENSVLFGSLLAVHKDYMKYKLSIALLEKAFKQWGSYGFKSVAGVSNNPISLKVFQSFGAKVVKVIKVNQNGKELSLYLIINDLADVVWPKL